MNFKRTKLILIMTVSAVISAWLHAESWMVTGDKAPDQSYQPLVPRLHDVQNFDQTDPAALTMARLQQFSATTVHGYTTQSPTRPAAIASVSLPAAALLSSAHDASTASANTPCPAGYKATPMGFTGNITCDDQQAVDPIGQPSIYVDSTFIMHSDGTPALYNEPFGNDFIMVGKITQRLLNENPGQVLYQGEYENYYVPDQAAATLVFQAECGQHLPVLYNGPAGGGYQVQVAELVPGTSSDDSQPPQFSPFPNNEINLCPPPPTSNN